MSLRAALSRGLRRAAAQAHSTADGVNLYAPTYGAAGAALVGGIPAAFEAVDQTSDMPQTDGDYRSQLDGAAGGAAWGGALGILAGSRFGRRTLLRDALDGMAAYSSRASWGENTRAVNAEAKKAMQRYIRYLRRVGFTEEADEAQHAYELALLDRHGYRSSIADRELFNNMARRSGENIYDEEANVRVDYGLNRIRQAERARRRAREVRRLLRRGE